MGSEGTPSPNGCAAACAVCGGAAAVYCAADVAVLCVPCDAAVHAANPLASHHERVPLAAAMAAEAANSGVYDLFAADDDGGSAATSWPTPAQGQGLGSPNNSSSCFTSDSGAERSLFDLLSDVDLMVCGGSAGANLSDGVAPHGAGSPWLQPGLPAVAAAWSLWSPPEAVVVPSAAAAVVAAAAEREARVRRYREKRKNRRFQKTIRYASRKAYAEARPRIKGRFVKRAATAVASNDDSTGATDAAEAVKFWLSSDDSRDDNVGFYVDAAAYGVVPSF